MACLPDYHIIALIQIVFIHLFIDIFMSNPWRHTFVAYILFEDRF